MKIRILTLLSLLVLSASVYSQTGDKPTPTPTPQVANNSDDDELKRQYQELQKKQADLEKKQKDYEDSIKVLSDDRNQKKVVIGSFEQRIASIESRYEKLNGVIEQRKENEVLTKKIQARAILDSYKRIVGDSRNMAFAFGFVQTNSALQSRINPINNNTFKDELISLRNKLGDNEKGLIGDNPIFKNPYISLALSIGSLLVSKFSGSEKINKFKNMVCVLDLSVKMSPKIEKFEVDLKTVKLGVDSFEKDTEAEFVDFVQRVTGNKTFTKFEDLDNPGFTDGNLEDAIEKYLNNPQVNFGRIDKENIKIRMDEYNSILNQTNNLLVALDDTFSEIGIYLSQTVCELPVGKEIANQFKVEIDTAKSDAERNKNRFRQIVAGYRNFLRVRKQILSESF